MHRRDFLKLASKTLGLLGIAPIFGCGPSGMSGIWINSTPYNSLAEAVKVAKSGDTIKLANGTFYTTDVVIPLGATIEAINSTLIGEKGAGLMFELD